MIYIVEVLWSEKFHPKNLPSILNNQKKIETRKFYTNKLKIVLIHVGITLEGYKKCTRDIIYQY